jgi:hypothetical protein
VLEIADGMTLTTLLWANGTFTYFNSMRCFHEQGTPEYAADVGRSVSQITQFMKANQIEAHLEVIYMAGVDTADMELYESVISQHGISVPVRLYQTPGITTKTFEAQQCLHSLAGLYVAGKRQNFLTQYKKTKGKGDSDKKSYREIIMVGGTLVVMLIILGVLLTVKSVKNRELKDLKDYNENPTIVMQVASYEQLLYTNTFLTAQASSIADLDENILTYPVCNIKVMNVIDTCAGDYADVTLDSFDANEGTIVVTAQSDTVENINKFITELLKQDIFSDVNYTGYTFQNDSGLWNINVSCKLAEAAGR